MRTVNPEKHEAKRRHIAAAAALCFGRKGFEQTTTAEISAAAGIAAGTLFHYFPTKRAIFAAIFEHDGQDIADLLAAADRLDDAWEAVLFIITGTIEPYVDQGLARLAVELLGQANRDPGLAAVVRRNDHTLRDGLVAHLDRAGRQGLVDTSIPPLVAANWIMAMTDGLFSRASLDPAFDPAAEQRTLQIILSRYLASRG